jgi:pimeloyl-ACP methyl ester carboxylesterase
MTLVDTGQVAGPRSLDAVLILPGIMGSELHDGDGSLLWGLSPRALVDAYRGDLLERLTVTDDDLSGRRGVTATGAIRYPGVLKWFRGSEDYEQLVTAAQNTAVDPRAVQPYPYDWRLSVASHAEDLVVKANAHRNRWVQIVRDEGLGDPDQVGLTLVAHSMGGLVARAACVAGLDQTPNVTVLTLGTPYYGSVKALRLIAEGSGSPLKGVDLERLRRFANSCPGVYDLLPRYSCINEAHGPRSLTPEDVASVGGDRSMAADAQARWDLLRLAEGPGNAVWHTLVGIDQPTLQSAAIDCGETTYFYHLERRDQGGDGTVYRQSAGPGWAGVSSSPIVQTHAALTASSAAREFVRDKLLHRDSAPRLGTSQISVDFPETATAGQPVRIRVARMRLDDGMRSPEGSHKLKVASADLEFGRSRRWAPGSVGSDGWMTSTHPGLGPGLHRLTVDGGSRDPVTELLWVQDS